MLREGTGLLGMAFGTAGLDQGSNIVRKIDLGADLGLWPFVLTAGYTQQSHTNKHNGETKQST